MTPRFVVYRSKDKWCWHLVSDVGCAFSWQDGRTEHDARQAIHDFCVAVMEADIVQTEQIESIS